MWTADWSRIQALHDWAMNSRRFRLTGWLFLLLAITPLEALSSDTIESDQTLSVYQRFAAIPQYLKDSVGSEKAQRQVHIPCARIDRQCVAFASDHADIVRASIPDNPDFWSAYATLLDASAIPLEDIDPDTLPRFAGIIEGSRAWVHRELVTNRVGDAERLHAQLSAQRRRLARSSVLMERMIFQGTAGIVLPAVNVHMAYRNRPYTSADQKLLDEMLSPLSKEELSLRRTFEGELRYMIAVSSEHPPVDYSEEQLDYWKRVFAFTADRSEASWKEFWRDGVDTAGRVEPSGDPGVLTFPLAGYVVNVRLLDASLYVLRALREVYEGRINPGLPVVAPPYGWEWVWKEASRELCLHPGYVHPSVVPEHTLEICHSYFEPQGARGQKSSGTTFVNRERKAELIRIH